MALLVDEMVLAKVFLQGTRLFPLNIIPSLPCSYVGDQRHSASVAQPCRTTTAGQKRQWRYSKKHAGSSSINP